MDSHLELPGLFIDADSASLAGQRQYLRLNRVRLSSAVLGAFGGASAVAFSGIAVGALVALGSFLVALAAELTLVYLQPERRWYEGRALAESMKTMAWCYAVGGAPFPPDLADESARALLHQRSELLLSKIGAQIPASTANPILTPSMSRLRDSDFESRRHAYLEGRTKEQRRWYAAKAEDNQHKADLWKGMLITTEVIAIAAATLKATAVWDFDAAGILGALVGSGAAWLSLRQHAQLASAYSLTSRELALQEEVLLTTSEESWPRAVSDAEDAISREHTTWMASHTT